MAPVGRQLPQRFHPHRRGFLVGGRDATAHTGLHEAQFHPAHGLSAAEAARTAIADAHPRAASTPCAPGTDASKPPLPTALPDRVGPSLEHFVREGRPPRSNAPFARGSGRTNRPFDKPSAQS